ncbi:AN1-type zinc finger protein 5-like [Grus japonensis]|uniref:AN1-type zinc finger protein 5-like n=1 Tax=Grus japonensis TaxID=30415 RepID=A0ABC9VU85_GRUJA
MPAGSKMDPPLAKDKPISDGGSASGPMEVHGGADIHLQPMEDPMPEQVETPEGGCDPVGSPHWSRLLAGPVDPWREEPMPGQVCWQDL